MLTLRSLPLISFLLLTIVPLSAQQQLSWRDQGGRAVGSGNLDSAQYYYERWLEADPGDEITWYNLACVHALQGDEAGALDAWEKSVEAGWSDADAPLKDSDLTSIRDDERFLAALEIARTRNEAKGPKGYIRNFLPTTSVGTYIALLPDDYETSGKTYPVCVILHGSGSTELAHGKLADMFGREGVIYVVPRAPYTHTDSYKGTGELGYTAWTPEKIDSLNILSREAPNFYTDWIMQCVEDARRHYRIDSKPAIILGHSQGAAFAYNTATRYPESIRSIFSYAGYYIEQYKNDEAIQKLKDNNIRVTLAHGASDNVVDPSESRQLDAALERIGVEHSLTLYDDTGHGIAKPVIEQMKEWINRETGRTHTSTNK